jgi:cytochrome c oxidase subunit II
MHPAGGTAVNARLRRARAAVGLLAITALAVACSGETNGAPDPVTEQGEKTLSIWNAFTWLALGIGALVFVLVAIIAIRYRRRGADDMPSQQQYSPKIEAAYTILPIIIVGLMWWFGWKVEDKVSALDKDPDVVVEVVGFQWQWQFKYPDEGILVQGTTDEPPTMVLPTDRTVRIKLSSNDVIHSFWVPEFLEKRDLIPEVDNQIQVTINEEGEWQGRCAEFCGLDHWRMYFTVKAVSPDEFDQWVADQQAAAATTTTTTATTSATTTTTSPASATTSEGAGA